MARLLLLLLLILPLPAHAQTPPTQAQARSALDVLKDEKKRTELITTLEAIAAATEPAAPALPLAPDSLGAQLIAGASERLDWLSVSLWRGLAAVTDFPLILRWFEVLFTDIAIRAQIIETAWRFGLALALALLAEAAVRRLLAPTRAALVARAPETTAAHPSVEGIAEAEAGATERLPRRLPALLGGLMTTLGRLPYALAGFVLDLLPRTAVLAVAYAAIGLGLGDGAAPRFVILASLHAYVLYGVVNGLARMTLAAEPRSLTLFLVPAPIAADLLSRLRWTAGVAIFGVTAVETALLFGMYRLAHDTVVKILALVVTVMICAAVLRHRNTIARLIRPAPEAKGVATAVRDSVAGVWHLVACGYLVSLWLVWAIDLPDGFIRLLRLSISTGIILALAWLGHRAMARLMLRATATATELPDIDPALAARLRSYLRALGRLARLAINIAAILAMLTAWGIPAFAWLVNSQLGPRLLAALANLAATFAFALLVWEGVNYTVERHLARLAADQQAARSARLRTLLPMLRTTLLVAISGFTLLITLSEIGVNIAPLLAGAGVIGLAIGFGSQKLVLDVITGLFLLLENAMQVGDSVTLGGLSGTVENLSIRTIRLRALDGSVHIIPFSAVTTVTNMTRDFGYAVIDLNIGLNESPDHISEILTALAEEMRASPPWTTAMTGPLDIMGVEKFLPDAWVMRARVRTTPSQRWAVGRELNRRIKEKFDELAIESPMTSTQALSRSPSPEAEASQ